MSASEPILISVIVPTLQEEKLLDSTLRTFTRQWRSDHNAELIVSDGGSTDRTIEIANAHADVVVLHTESRRQTIAEGRNQGALQARGEVLVFINGDTIPADLTLFTSTLEDFAHRRGPYARASALACPVRFVPSDERLADRLFHGYYNTYVRLLSMFRIGAGRGECQVVRKKMFVTVGGYKNHLVAGEDFDLLARVGMKGRVLFARELLVFESPRRFRKFGYFRVIWSWTINGLSVLLRGRSTSDEWEPVR
ncbi:MAG: hypothetical protein RIR53_1289 [Bacteroidota bacterium]